MQSLCRPEAKGCSFVFLLRSAVFHVLVCYLCRAGTAITVKISICSCNIYCTKMTEFGHGTFFIMFHFKSSPCPVFFMSVMSKHTVRWIFATYLVKHICTLTINYILNQSSLIAFTKIYSSHPWKCSKPELWVELWTIWSSEGVPDNGRGLELDDL